MSDIEISKKSIKISYRRFLSDGASGAFLLTSIIIIIHNETNFVETFVRSDITDKAPIYALLLIATLPIGVFLNTFGWLLLGPLQLYSEKWLFLSKGLLPKIVNASTNMATFCDEQRDIFGIDSDNYFKKTRSIFHFLETNFSEQLSYSSDIIGFLIFFRSSSLIFIINAIYFYNKAPTPALFLLMAALIFMLSAVAASTFVTASALAKFTNLAAPYLQEIRPDFGHPDAKPLSLAEIRQAMVMLTTTVQANKRPTSGRRSRSTGRQADITPP